MSFGPLRLLALLTLMLAAGLAWMWLDQQAQPRNLTWVAPKPLAPDIKVPANPGQPAAAEVNPTMFAVILERPLFAPDRRPPPPPTPAPPPDPFATIKIQGIFSGANAGILASVDNKTRRVKINETIGNWTLKSINGRDVTFTQGDDNRTVRLAYARLDAPAPQNLKANAQAAPAPAPVPAPASAPTPTTGATNLPQTAQDEARERLRRRNELRTSRGLPPVTE